MDCTVHHFFTQFSTEICEAIGILWLFRVCVFLSAAAVDTIGFVANVNVYCFVAITCQTSNYVARGVDENVNRVL